MMKMRVYLCLLLTAVGVLADNNDERRSKLPYVADAVGNTLPPPSSLPATVGSPVDLITPDRYEFYTFDESGELVKRLMTLEEIQAIVAAGEETEGLVTFANDNQPTIAFNFSQPPYTKVHSVVTNVQNVLKAQMEAHRNKPQPHPTFDTPDVSDSWSLILPSIFGNTGVDIVPDKSSSTFTTPETVMIEIESPNEQNENSLSKEGDTHIASSSTAKTPVDEDSKNVPVAEVFKTSSTSTSIPTTTTVFTTTTPKSRITTVKPTTASAATRKSTTTTSTTVKLIVPSMTTTTATPRPTPTTTTSSIPASTTTTTPKLTSTTTTTTTTPKSTSTTTTTTTPFKSTMTSSTTTNKLMTTSTTNSPTTNELFVATTYVPTATKFTQIIAGYTTTSKPLRATYKTTSKPDSLTNTETSSDENEKDSNLTVIKNETNSHVLPTTDNSVHFEKISTFIPVATVTYVTERTTRKPVQIANFSTFSSSTKDSVTTIKPVVISTTKSPSFVVPTTYKPSISNFISSTIKEFEKNNATTITTQSVSPSTTVSSTEFMSLESQVSNELNNNKSVEKKNPNINVEDQPVPLFDVAQSISQIASDLGSNTNYQPIPTTNNLLETTKVNGIDLESKESLEIDMTDSKKNTETTTVSTEPIDSFVIVTTFDPHAEISHTSNVPKDEVQENENKTVFVTTPKTEITTDLPVGSTIDPILSESMDDLLSQVVNLAPQSIIDDDSLKEEKITTTEATVEVTTILLNQEVTSDKINSAKDSISKINESAVTKVTLTNITLDNKKQSLNGDEKEIRKNETKIIFEPVQNLNGSEEDVMIPISAVIATDATKQSHPSTIIDKSKIVSLESNIRNKVEMAQKQTLSTQKEDKKPTIISNHSQISQSTTSTDLLQKTNTHTKIVEPLIQAAVAKANSSNNNERTNLPETNKIIESYPKVDEFKKKIQKVNIDDKELASERNSSWKLISTVIPPRLSDTSKDKQKVDANVPENYEDKDIILDFSKENQGLEVTTKDLGDDIAQFTELCNELAFRYWNALVENIDKKRSFVMSPFSITSMLAMMFMGARGATSGEMNEILKLDDMVTFNPHFTLKNISDSIETTPESGVTVSAFVRELYSDKNKGKILTFYKERAQHFYNGYVEEVNFKLISDIIRRRTNLLVKRYSWGKIVEYMKSNTITMQPPLAAFSANIFQTDCNGSSVEGRDGEMYFVVSPNVRQRRLVPVPAVVYRRGFLAGYDPVLDATAAALGNTNSIVSTLFLMPGQQGNVVHVEDLETLEKRLLEANPTTPTWNRLLRTLLPRVGLELQIPRFSHKSIFNISSTLRKMGLKDLFDAEHADLGGLNGPPKDLYLSDMIQSTMFVTCGEGVIGEQHHTEEYPETLELTRRRRTSRWINGWDEPRDYQRAFHDPHDVGDAMHLPLHLRPRQARLPARNAQPARLKFDRPFLYFVRHNPSGMILYVGRYNPRLLP